jgi:hypothetical protein
MDILNTYGQIIISSIFVAICAGTSWRSGFKTGVTSGYNATMLLLELQKVASAQKSPDDKVQVHTTGTGKNTEL